MTEKIHQTLRDSKAARWTALAVVAFTMLCGYFLTDVMAPLKPMLEKELLWTSTDYGIFTSAYGWFNVFLLMLIFGGIILDKMGVRFTGLGACILMVIGCTIKYGAVSGLIPLEGTVIAGMKGQVAIAALGYAIFGVGVEIAGITVSKIIVKWFKGYEMGYRPSGNDPCPVRHRTYCQFLRKHLSPHPAVSCHAVHRSDCLLHLYPDGPQAGGFHRQGRGFCRRRLPPE